MAQKPDGKPARTERVTFTRPAADRIAKVVRRVELGNRDGAPLVYDRIGDSVPVGSALKLATFTGSWAIGTYKTVTLHGSTQTASVYNWTTPVASASTARYVIFGKASGTNAAVEIQFDRQLRIGTTTGSWNKDTTATIDGISGIRNYWGNVASGKRVGFQMAADGNYYLVVAEC